MHFFYDRGLNKIHSLFGYEGYYFKYVYRVATLRDKDDPTLIENLKHIFLIIWF